MIVFFTGPSASGKDYYRYYFSEMYDFDEIILHTTRPIRAGEVDGKDYYFITAEKMNEMDKNGLLIERRDYSVVNNDVWSYATSSSAIDLSRNQIVVGSLSMLDSFIKYYGREKVIPFFFQVDDNIRLVRAANRGLKKGENPLEICRRFMSDSVDFQKEKVALFQPYIIDNNDSQESTIEQIDFYIKPLFEDVSDKKIYVKNNNF